MTPWLDGDALRRLIPHAGRMCLLDSVLRWDDDTIHCRSGSHRHVDHPLRAQGRLAALHLIEYGAQAMAVHGGLLAQAQGGVARAGLLVSVRDAVLEVDRLDDIADDLDVIATRRVAGTGGWLYAFDIRAAQRQLAHGRVAVLPATTAGA